MTWCSQAGQDEWVHSIIGDQGWFVDVGAYDGVEHSNTWALERFHGWDGICVEPQAEPYARLTAARECFTEQAIVAATGGGWGHMIGDVAHVGGMVGSVPVVSLIDVLNRFGSAVEVVDYLSIDVEGQELEVLAGMDFDRWSVRLATIEHNLYRDGPAHRDAIRERMIGLGFVLAAADVVAPGYGPYEDWWIHQAAL